MTSHEDVEKSSALRDRIAEWISFILANRAVVEPVKDTERGFIGKVKGLPTVLVCIADAPDGESQILAELREKLVHYAERLIAAGKPLPVWDRPTVQPTDAVIRCVRLSTLRKLLKQRAGEWAAQRKNLPPHVLPALLADIDQLITRHASAMASAT